MMARLTYETADTLVYDPVTGNRAATRAVLFTLGFRNIETVGTVEDFAAAIKARPPDLALCEVQGADSDLCTMIQALRQGTHGYNPFIVIIVTAWEKTNSLVGRVLNSGADDLVLRPFSTTLLRKRIDTHVERRKGFVITHDYVGPDRRSDPKRASNVELFEPPNSLKMKAKEGLSAEEVGARLDEELRCARETLVAEKLRRDAFQIGILWRLLQEPGEGESAKNLAKLTVLAASVAKRCRNSEFEGSSQWCESVVAAAEGLRVGIDRNASMHLLGHSALNLIQVLQPQKSAGDHLKTLEETVAMIRARNRPPQSGALRAAAGE
jgi:DNA-binding response OmpR family regulator